MQPGTYRFHSADRFNDSLMKKKILLLGLFLPFCSYAEQPTGKLPVDWVDTQLGATHCRWFFYTPAALPFGMAKLGRHPAGRHSLPLVFLYAGSPAVRYGQTGPYDQCLR